MNIIPLMNKQWKILLNFFTSDKLRDYEVYKSGNKIQIYGI